MLYDMATVNSEDVRSKLKAAIGKERITHNNRVCQNEAAASGPIVNGSGLKYSSGSVEAKLATHCSDDEDGSVISRGDDSKDETDPSSPAAESFDGDLSLSPEHFSAVSEKLLITQEPTLIVNGLDIYYKCKLCFKVFSTEQRWKRHKQDTHFNPRLHVCPICGERFKRSTHLKRHRDRRHVPQSMAPVVPMVSDKRRFSCPQCPRVFERANKLLAHIQQYHQNKRPFRCSTCNEGFKRQDHLNRHRESKSHKLRVVLANKPEYGDDVINCGDVPKEMMQSFASHTGMKPQTLASLVENGKLMSLKDVDSQSNSSFDPRASEETMMVRVSTPGSSIKSVALDCSVEEITPPSAAVKSDTSVDNSISPVPMEESYSKYLSNSITEALATVSPEPEDLSTSWGQDGAVTCILCGKIFESEKRMKIHLRQTHSTERRHICRLCGERFKRSTHLRRHMNSNKHQRLSQACGSSKPQSTFGYLDDLDEEELILNGLGSYTRPPRGGKHRFPKGHYLDDYDDIPITMVPRSHPLQLCRGDAEEEPNGHVAMETEGVEPEKKSSSYNSINSLYNQRNDDVDEGRRESHPSLTPNTSYYKSSGLISLLDRKRVYPKKYENGKSNINSIGNYKMDKMSIIKAEPENLTMKSAAQESSPRGITPVSHAISYSESSLDRPRSTLRSLLQNSVTSYKYSREAHPEPVSSGTGWTEDWVRGNNSGAAQYIVDMSRQYSLKPWQCALCQSLFETRLLALTHIQNVHTDLRPHSSCDLRPHPCDLCDKAFMTQRDLEGHYALSHRLDGIEDTIINHNIQRRPAKSVNRRKKTKPRKVLYNIEADKGQMEVNDSDLENNMEDDLDLDIDLTEIMSRANGSLSPVSILTETDAEEDSETTVFVKKNTVVNRNNFECRICQRVFSTRPNLHTHIRQIHQNVRPFTCNYCGENFKRGTHLRIHISRKHYDDVLREDPFIEDDRQHSNEVMVIYPKPSQLLHNSLLRNSTGIWKCTRCPKTFPKKDVYQHHMKLHLAAENCACPFCNQVFSHEKSLREHLRSHENEPRYVCGLCNVSFLLQSAYESHIKEHEENNMDDSDDGYYDNDLSVVMANPPVTGKPISLSKRKPDISEMSPETSQYEEQTVNDLSKIKQVIINLETVCAVCNEEYEDMDSLRAHTRAHKKPYRCQYCSKKYDNISYLERHTRVHTGSKPYVCSVCNRGFPRKERAEEHIVKYH